MRYHTIPHQATHTIRYDARMCTCIHSLTIVVTVSQGFPVLKYGPKNENLRTFLSRQVAALMSAWAAYDRGLDTSNGTLSDVFTSHALCAHVSRLVSSRLTRRMC